MSLISRCALFFAIRYKIPGYSLSLLPIRFALALIAVSIFCAIAGAQAAKDCEEKSGDAGIAACTLAIQQNPQDAKSYDFRGKEYYLKGELDRAIADFSEAIRIEPNFSDPYNNRGLAYSDKKNYSRAITDFSKAIQLDPKDHAAYLNRGVAYYYSRNDAKALEDYNEAIRLNPEDSKTFYSRALLYLSTKEQNRAIADFRTAAQLGDKDANVRLRELGVAEDHCVVDTTVTITGTIDRTRQKPDGTEWAFTIRDKRSEPCKADGVILSDRTRPAACQPGKTITATGKVYLFNPKNPNSQIVYTKEVECR